jgi:hypothetical protein
MLNIQVIFMPVIWDVVPICTIYYLHHLNFTVEPKQLQDSMCGRETYQRPSNDFMSRETAMPISGHISKEEYENTKRKYT